MPDVIRPRGRPRSFDERTARAQIQTAFWSKGYSSTSLDDLAAATGMKRASLYGAFGNKQAMYGAALDEFAEMVFSGMERAFTASNNFREGLYLFFEEAIQVYTSDDLPRGCFIFCTGPAEANADPAIAERLLNIIAKLDDSVATRIKMAVSKGEMHPATDPIAAGQLVVAILHSLALRARAGAPCGDLSDYIARILPLMPWRDTDHN